MKVEQNSMEILEKKVQRLLDIQEVKNLMARVMYYHSAHMDDEIFNNYMAWKTPGVAHEDNDGRFEGLEAIRKKNIEFARKYGAGLQLKEMRKLYPEIEDDPKNESIGQSVWHTLTTDCIEVAEDGQTAKGVWLSPGYFTRAVRGKLRAFWHYDKHAVDFVKEDGEWKIWHMHVYKDFMCPYEKSWVENAINPDPQARLGWSEAVEAGGELPKGNVPKLDTWKPYHPLRVDGLEPRPPEPYRTFSETFSY